MAPKARPNRVLTALCTKTRMCMFLEPGTCLDGERCCFAHSPEELRGAPDLLYTRLCKNFTKGHCNAGKNCRFAHGEHMLRKKPSRQQARLNEEGSSSGASSGTSDCSISATCADDMRESFFGMSIMHRGDSYPDVADSLLDWDPNVESVRRVNGMTLSVKNTFLDADSEADCMKLKRRTRSAPPACRRC
eukprot:TRINITY_DN114738_c0_g1_i1.p1 TRINITY_DN114738_c0_g1~~TRINITY_DN114738_c0_g1_i1.p1  ORF type:complete len:207 (-),score=18.71 TRINITY_DN114738_c0_g1_i1:63-632(-)